MVCIGLDLFYDALIKQDAEATRVVPPRPPKLEKRLADALDRLL